MQGGLRTFVLVASLLAAGSGCGKSAKVAPVSTRVSAAKPTVQSNVLRSDYAGSDACRPCHREIHDSWQDSPMHRMTRRAATTQIRAPFDGSIFRLRDDSVTLYAQGETKFMRLDSRELGSRLYRVTKVIGGRYREDFVGIDVTGTADPRRSRGRGAERVMPVSYVFSSRSFRYKGYSVMIPERPSLRPGGVWAATCIGCHNTLPQLVTFYDELYGADAPAYQGRVASHLVPEERAWIAEVEDEAGLRQAVHDELQRLGDEVEPSADHSLRETLKRAMGLTYSRLQDTHLVELGIGCEACHGGSREHAEDPTRLPSFEPRSPLFRFGPRSGSATRAQSINHGCMRCHTVLFSGYPWTWEGGQRRDRVPGGSTTNSGEARDFLLGGCASQLQCTRCHDPHAEDGREQLARIESLRGNRVCVSCHDELASEAALAAHSHHPARSEASACVGCHMAKKNTALDYRLSRYHRIGSPSDPERVLGDRPLECALCHRDKSVRELITTMERWWGKRYDRKALSRLYPELDANALLATLEHGKAHEQAAAMMALGQPGAEHAVAVIAAQLSHDYPLLRYFAKQALEQITGEPLAIDAGAPADAIAAEARRWLAARSAAQADPK